MRARGPAWQLASVGRLEAHAQHVLRNQLGVVHQHAAADAALRGFADAHRLLFGQHGGVGALGVAAHIPLNPQMFGAAERGVGHIGEALLGQLHMRQAARELFKEDLHFHAGQILAHALVGAVAEG